MASVAERLAALREKAENPVERESYPVWDPRPGKDSEGEDVLAGTVKRRETVAFDWGSSDVVEIETEDGTVRSVWLGPIALRNGFEGVEVGDLVVIQYHGMKEPKKGGNPYHHFAVATDKAARDEATRDAVERTFPGAKEERVPPTDDQVESYAKALDALKSYGKDWQDRAEHWLAEQFGPEAKKDPSSSQLEALIVHLRAEYVRLSEETPF